MAGERQTQFNNSFAEWQNMTAFNTYWQYSMVNRSLYYANIASEYREYMTRWVQNYLWWYDGWVPYFHNADQGIFSTKIASALVNGAAKKVIGGHIYFKNKNKEQPQKGDDGKYIINKALAYISSEWSDKVNFPREMKKAVVFAAAAGTSLLKLDKHDGVLVPKALRFDSFYPTVGFNGELIELTCFIRDFTKTYDGGERKSYDSYYVVEHRYFGDYKEADGTISRNKPLVEYEIRYTRGSITGSQDYSPDRTARVELREIKDSVRRKIVKAFDGIALNKPIPLPFHDSLGAEIVNWTDCVTAIPELPFGDSLLANILPYLQSYDYYWSAFNTDMYLGRGRVLLPKPMQNPKAASQNSGWDRMLFTAYETMAGGDMNSKKEPTPIQFDLRSSSWKEIRDMIVQNIAINTGMNLATIASFLNDAVGTRTAREISTEESETALFVEDKREILEKPINRILKLVTLSQGFTDDVVVRWSETGLTNPYTRTDMLATAVQNGFISLQTAAQMFRQDDDEYQQAEEWDKIQSDRNGQMEFTEDEYMRYFNDTSKPTAEQTGDSFGGGGNKNQSGGEE